MPKNMKRIYIGSEQYEKIKRFCQSKSIKMIDFINMVVDSVIDDNGEMKRETIILDKDVIEELMSMSIKLGKTPSEIVRMMIDTIQILFSDNLPLYKALRPLSELKLIVMGGEDGR